MENFKHIECFNLYQRAEMYTTGNFYDKLEQW